MIKIRGLFILIICLFSFSLADAIEDYKDFIVDQHILRVLNVVNEVNQKELKIKNTGSADLDFSIDLTELKNFIKTEERFTLQTSREKNLILNFKSNQTGVFTGNIIINAGSISKIIPIILEVESNNPIFDITTSIPAKFKEVNPKQSVVAQIIIFGVRNTESVNIPINYLIKDLHNNVVFNDSEIIKVNNKLSYLREIKLPNLEEGDYVLIAEVKYKGLNGVSSSIFRVIEKNIQTSFIFNDYFLYLIVAIIILFIGVIFFICSGLKKQKDEIFNLYKPKSEIELEKERLIKKMKLLKNSFKLNYITRREYTDELKNIKEELRKIDKK